MKILMVNKFFRIVGGSDTYCFALSDALKAAGHEVVFFSMKDSRNLPCDNESDFVENIDYNTTNKLKKIKYAVKYIYSLEAKRKIAAVLDREKPDVVHLNHIHHQITLSVVEEISKRNIPMVFTLHDVICACPNYMMLANGHICEKCMDGHYYHCVSEACVKGSRVKSFLAMVEAYNYKRMGVYNKIDLYISPTSFYKKKLTEAHFTNSPIVHMRNLLPMNTQYEVSKDRKDYCLYFGRLSREKGIITLIEALSQCRAIPKLLIVGEGELRDEVEKLVISKGLKKQVMLLGYKSGKELKDIVQGAKCVILPSEWYENGPYAIEEAMACGTPTIVSSNGGLPEAVEDGVTGFICEPCNPKDLAKKIDMLYALDEKQYFKMCKNAVEKAQRDFSAEMYVSNILKLYQELIRKHEE